MLRRLSIRNIVLIDRLDIDLDCGLCVITGETGAGKSVFLDSLGLALGFRADSNLLGTAGDQASVTAAFELPDTHPVHVLLDAQGIAETRRDALFLRRVLSGTPGDGRSRAYINDQPVSAGLLRSVGESLVEIEGQFAEQGLLNPATHQTILDSYGGLTDLSADTRRAWDVWKTARARRDEAEAGSSRTLAEIADLQASLDELGALNPRAGEVEELEQRRKILANAEKLTQTLNQAHKLLAGDDVNGGTSTTLQASLTMLERTADLAGGRFDPVLEGLQRAAIEINEAASTLAAMQDDLAHNPGQLDTVDDRLHELRRIARKYDVKSDELVNLSERISERLKILDGGQDFLEALRGDEKKAAQDYHDHAERLSKGRHGAMQTLDTRVREELPALKLERARFATSIVALPEEKWTGAGKEAVSFTVSTNPDKDLAPLNRVASGGELSRFMLALKVVTCTSDGLSTLVFDEVDSGIGGAVAAAVGERLARLGQERQVLVVTHSPQVAAAGDHHWRISKRNDGTRTLTEIMFLSEQDRREEIARMLSASRITDEARAAAQRLLQTSQRS